MTYANAVLPHSLFAAAELWPEGPFLSVAEATFAFLVVDATNERLLLSCRQPRLVCAGRDEIPLRPAAGRGLVDGLGVAAAILPFSPLRTPTECTDA